MCAGARPKARPVTSPQSCLSANILAAQSYLSVRTFHVYTTEIIRKWINTYFLMLVSGRSESGYRPSCVKPLWFFRELWKNWSTLEPDDCQSIKSVTSCSSRYILYTWSQICPSSCKYSFSPWLCCRRCPRRQRFLHLHSDHDHRGAGTD